MRAAGAEPPSWRRVSGDNTPHLRSAALDLKNPKQFQPLLVVMLLEQVIQIADVGAQRAELIGFPLLRLQFGVGELDLEGFPELVGLGWVVDVPADRLDKTQAVGCAMDPGEGGVAVGG